MAQHDASIKLMLAAAESKLFHMKELEGVLTRLGVECRTVNSELYNGFPNRNVSSWLWAPRNTNALFDEFRPDAVLVDHNGDLAKRAIERGVPLLSHLRGDYWSEIEWYKQTLGKDPVRRLGRYMRGKIEEKCFGEATLILPICNYLKNVVEQRYPGKSATMYQGIDPGRWNPRDVDGNAMELRHPCVGLLQSANIWGKVREMRVLPEVMRMLPEVTFYWAGGGPYQNEVLPELTRHDNFKWLGTLDYPDAVKRYLREVDVYALISGIDMSPLTLQEAQLMQKPVIATNVGGIPELMRDKTTGFLVERQNAADIAARIEQLLNDDAGSREMGKNGRRFVQENFNWEKVAVDFVRSMRRVLD